MVIYSIIVVFAIFLLEYVLNQFGEKTRSSYPGYTALLKTMEWAIIGLWFYFLVNPSALIPLK